jgi:hypothetical protein
MAKTSLVGESFQDPASADVNLLERLRINSSRIAATAMKLTDSWGQAMFVVDPILVRKLFVTLGFSEDVSSRLFDEIRTISYVKMKKSGF